MIIRLADVDDSLDIWRWKNDLQTRSMSFDTREILLFEHEVWFKRSIISGSCRFYIGMKLDHKIGVCRYDLSLDEPQSEVSINMNPQHRGKGLSRPFLMLSMREILTIRPGTILARIKKENKASIRIFESCGFKQKLSENGALVYSYS